MGLHVSVPFQIALYLWKDVRCERNDTIMYGKSSSFSWRPARLWPKSNVKTVKPDGTPNKAAWMAQGTYGMMVHYLIKPQGNTPEEKTADLNRTVDNFDLDHFMRQFDQTGADWLIFTLAQGTGYLSSKNEVIDDLQQGLSPNRDLIPEIGEAAPQAGARG